jgi:hypothetical protein
LWSTTTNWIGGTVADGAGSLANFSALDIGVNSIVSLDSARRSDDCNSEIQQAAGRTPGLWTTAEIH